jgi:hypothetical protein
MRSPEGSTAIYNDACLPVSACCIVGMSEALIRSWRVACTVLRPCASSKITIVHGEPSERQRSFLQMRLAAFFPVECIENGKVRFVEVDSKPRDVEATRSGVSLHDFS